MTTLGRLLTVFQTQGAAKKERALKRIATQAVNTEDKLKRFGKTVERNERRMVLAAGAAGGLAGALSVNLAGAVNGLISAVPDLTDRWIRLENRLKVVLKDGDTLEQTFLNVQSAALATGASIEAVAENYSRLARATDHLGLSTKQVTHLTEAYVKAAQLSGATTAEVESAMIQLSQGLGSDALRGDELRSVMEQAPLLALEIAKAFGQGVKIGDLKDLAEEGLLTSELVAEAMLRSRDRINRAYEDMTFTLEQEFESLRTKAISTFGPMTDVIIQNVSPALRTITANFEEIIEVITRLGTIAGITFGVLATGSIGRNLASSFGGLAAKATLAVPKGGIKEATEPAILRKIQNTFTRGYAESQVRARARTRNFEKVLDSVSGNLALFGRSVQRHGALFAANLLLFSGGIKTVLSSLAAFAIALKDIIKANLLGSGAAAVGTLRGKAGTGAQAIGVAVAASMQKFGNSFSRKLTQFVTHFERVLTNSFNSFASMFKSKIAPALLTALGIASPIAPSRLRDARDFSSRQLGRAGKAVGGAVKGGFTQADRALLALDAGIGAISLSADKAGKKLGAVTKIFGSFGRTVGRFLGPVGKIGSVLGSLASYLALITTSALRVNKPLKSAGGLFSSVASFASKTGSALVGLVRVLSRFRVLSVTVALVIAGLVRSFNRQKEALSQAFFGVKNFSDGLVLLKADVERFFKAMKPAMDGIIQVGTFIIDNIVEGISRVFDLLFGLITTLANWVNSIRWPWQSKEAKAFAERTNNPNVSQPIMTDSYKESSELPAYLRRQSGYESKPFTSDPFASSPFSAFEGSKGSIPELDQLRRRVDDLNIADVFLEKIDDIESRILEGITSQDRIDLANHHLPKIQKTVDTIISSAEELAKLKFDALPEEFDKFLNDNEVVAGDPAARERAAKEFQQQLAGEYAKSLANADNIKSAISAHRNEIMKAAEEATGATSGLLLESQIRTLLEQKVGAEKALAEFQALEKKFSGNPEALQQELKVLEKYAEILPDLSLSGGDPEKLQEIQDIARATAELQVRRAELEEKFQESAAESERRLDNLDRAIESLGEVSAEAAAKVAKQKEEIAALNNQGNIKNFGSIDDLRKAKQAAEIISETAEEIAKVRQQAALARTAQGGNASGIGLIDKTEADTITDLQSSREERIAGLEELIKATEKAADVERQLEENRTRAQNIEDGVTQAFDNFLEDLVVNGEEAFSNLSDAINNTFKQLAVDILQGFFDPIREQIRQWSRDLGKDIFEGAFGGGSGGGGGFLQNLFQQGADFRGSFGGVFSGNGVSGNASQRFGAANANVGKVVGQDGTALGVPYQQGSTFLQSAGQALGKIAGVAGAGFAGYQAGSTIGSLIRPEANSTNQMVGGAIGGTIGAAIGGPLGAAIGAFLGSIAGSLFGKASSDAARAVIDLDSSRTVFAENKNNNAENIQGRDQFVDTITKITSAVARISGQDFGGTNLGVQVGSRDGFTILRDATVPGSQLYKDSNVFKKTKSAEEALTAALTVAFMSFEDGTSIITDYAKAATRANTDAQLLVETIELMGKYFGEESLGSFHDQLIELEADFDILKAEFQAVGLSMEQLSSKLAEERQKIVNDFNESISDDILREEAPIVLSIKNAFKEFSEQIKEAQAIGGDEQLVQSLLDTRLNAIIDEAGSGGNVEDLVNAINQLKDNTDLLADIGKDSGELLADIRDLIEEGFLQEFERTLFDELLGLESPLAAQFSEVLQKNAQLAEDVAQLAGIGINVDPALVSNLRDARLNEFYSSIAEGSLSLEELQKGFTSLAMRIDEFEGLTMQQLEDVFGEALMGLRTAFDDDVSSRIRAIENPVRNQANDLLKAQEEELKRAKDIGANIVQLIQLQSLERQQFFNSLSDDDKLRLGDLEDLVESFGGKISILMDRININFVTFIDNLDETVSATQEAADNYGSLAESIANSISLIEEEFFTGTGRERLNASRRRLMELQDLAQSGDEQALAGISEAANTFLQLSQAAYGGSAQFANDQRFALDILKNAEEAALQFQSEKLTEIDALNTQVDVLRDIRDLLAGGDPTLSELESLVQGLSSDSPAQEDLLKLIALLREEQIAVNTAYENFNELTLEDVANLSESLNSEDIMAFLRDDDIESILGSLSEGNLFDEVANSYLEAQVQLDSLMLFELREIHTLLEAAFDLSALGEIINPSIPNTTPSLPDVSTIPLFNQPTQATGGQAQQDQNSQAIQQLQLAATQTNELLIELIDVGVQQGDLISTQTNVLAKTGEGTTNEVNKLRNQNIELSNR